MERVRSDMKFVVAVDGSDASDRALDHAVAMTAAADGELAVVHAVDPDVYDTGGPDPAGDRSKAERRLIIEDVEDAENRGEELLEDAAERAADAGPAVDTELLYGNPVETVSSFATTDGYDGIFVGHRGLSEREERVLGSVAKGLVERADVPVTVVR
jgi:nucleotide-binding universal stress UspA family protein